MIKKVILVGHGGHSKSCIEVFKEKKTFKIFGYIDLKKKNSVFKYLGKDTEISNFIKKYYFFISFAFIKNYKKRDQLIKKLNFLDAKFINLISNKAYVSKSSKIGEGVAVLKFAYIGPDTNIGSHSIINTGVVVEHDVKIGKNVHLATKSVVNGESSIGDNSFIGSGTIISNNISIGRNVIIGSGLKITKDIQSNSKII